MKPLSETSWSAATTTSLFGDGVQDFRHQALLNGYSPVPLQTGGKAPTIAGWNNGVSRDLLFAVDSASLNTGINCSGLRVIDVDVDDPSIAKDIQHLAGRCLPGHPLVRRRKNSARVALVYAAEAGAPGKLKVGAKAGVFVEVLGHGQQFLAHGTHPSGVAIEWMDERSPAVVPFIELPRVSETQVELFLRAAAEAIGLRRSAEILPFVPRPANVQAAALANRELSAGIEEGGWFERLEPSEMRAVVKLCLEAIDNTKNDPRDVWMRVLFAVAHAGELGCPQARELALEWSRRGAAWTGEADFDKLWNSYK